MTDQQTEENILKVSDEDADIAFSGPAYLTNRIFISGNTGNVIRITFAEQDGLEKRPIFRTAVAMGLQDAVALQNLLTSVLNNIQEQILAIKPILEEKIET